MNTKLFSPTQLPFAFCFGLSLSLLGCGGSPSATPATNNAAVISSPALAVTLLPDSKVKVVATAADASAVDSYCFQSSLLSAPTPTAPASTDSCFAASATKASLDLTPSSSTRNLISVWSAKGAVVSLLGRATAPGKTCSSAATTAAATWINNNNAAKDALQVICFITDAVGGLGETVLVLNGTKASNSTANFLRYVNEGFYDQTTFHRVLSGSVAQGGGFSYNSSSNTFAQKPVHDAIALENTNSTGLTNKAFSIAMARTSVADSATSQFFVNVVANTAYNYTSAASPGYAVFGEVVYQTALWTALANVATRSNAGTPFGSGENSLPATPVMLQWAHPIP